jgi:hypothetical protein
MEASGIRSTTAQTTDPKPASTSGSSAPATTPKTAFDATLRALLRSEKAGSISEEDLFAGLVQERVQALKGEETLNKLKELLNTSQNTMKKADGYIPMEDAAKDALRKLRDAGALTAEEADSVYSQAFAAAQLDGNTEVLYDGRGGKNDPTIAVATMEEALLKSRAIIDEFTAGTKTATIRSIEEASTGKSASAHASNTSNGSGDFLFKPRSDTNGNLVVLLPPRLTGLATGVRLVSPDGQVLESGRYTGNGNGGREHFRFNKPGGNYPDGLTVEVLLRTGEVVRYLIEETSERKEGGSSREDAASSPTTAQNTSQARGSRATPSKSSSNASNGDAKPDL